MFPSHDRGVTINVETGAMGFIVPAAGRTAVVPYRNAWGHDLAIDVNGNIYCHGDGVDDGSVAYDFQLLTKKFDYGNPRSWKQLQSVITAVRKLEGTVEVRAGYSENIDDTPTWTAK